MKSSHSLFHIRLFGNDSVCVTREIKTHTDDLGGFGFDDTADNVFYLQNGFYRFGDKWKLRGLGKLGKREVEHVDTIEKDGRLYMEYEINRTRQLASSIIQNKIHEIGRIKKETREINLNADEKRFWMESLSSISDKKLNHSFPLNPQIFPKAFELNEDYE